MIHALTFDVEDYPTLVARFWMGREQPPTEAVVRSTRQVLDLLAERGVRATFFVLGEVASCFPGLMRDINSAGHELGVHGYYHHQVFTRTPEQFRREVSDAKAVLEDAVGNPVRGHRAPAFSIIPETRWALEIVAELGFTYDSSIFPIAGRRYGWPGFPLDIHEMVLPGGLRLIEAPLSTVRLCGRRWPVCGGGYMRHFPAGVTRWALARVSRERPGIVYVHPHELDAAPITFKPTGGLLRTCRIKLAHHLQLRKRHTVYGKLAGLLQRFEFAPLGDVVDRRLAAMKAPAPACMSKPAHGL